MTADLSVLLEPGILLRIAIQVVLFVASAFFSGSETALFSLSRMDLRKLRRDRSPLAETVHALLDQPRRLIISVLCGNTLVNIAATANMTGILIAIYGVEAAAWISTFVMVPLLLLFGEATPKTIAVSDPIRVSTNIVARPMSVWVAFVSPMSRLVRRVSDRISVTSQIFDYHRNGFSQSRNISAPPRGVTCIFPAGWWQPCAQSLGLCRISPCMKRPLFLR